MRFASLVVAAGLAFAGAAHAQSLQELYEAARGYDATYLAARALADSAQYRLAQTRALNRPSAGLSAGVSHARTDPPASTFNPEGNASTGTVGSLTLSGRQPLFNRSNSATIAQAQKAYELSKSDLETAEQDLILRVTLAYFDVLAAQDTLATTQASKTAISEQLASAKRNFEVGTATITDTREAQARFDLGTAQEIAADNDLRTKRIALDQLVGRSGVAPSGLAVPVVLPPLAPPTVNEWVVRADAAHPLIRKALIALDVARLETEKARAGHLPTLDAVASAGGSRSGGTTTSASIGVQFNLPLYSGGSVQNRIRETLILEDKSSNDLAAARRGVTQGTQQAFFGVQSGQAQVKALEAAESSSQLALEATQLGYRVGVRVNLDVLNAQTQLFSTRRDLARARYDVIVGGLRLRQASGRLTPEDVNAVNQLLAK